MSSQTEWAKTTEVDPAAKRWTTRALWMLPVFAVWAVLLAIGAWVLHAIFGEAPVRGEVVPVETFGSWLGFTAVLVVPLVVGLAMAAYALAREGGRRAMVALVLHLGALVLVLTPAVIDRIGPPTG